MTLILPRPVLYADWQWIKQSEFSFRTSGLLLKIYLSL